MDIMNRNHILEIEYPKPGKLRARKVISRSKARATGKYPAWKMGRMVHWESVHELHAFRLLDANPAVQAFYEQPLTIHYVLGGAPHRHYPDVLVVLTNGTKELWEIKTAEDAAEPEYAARTAFLQAALPDQGFEYRMILGEDLGRNPRLGNVMTVLKFGRAPLSIVEHENVRRALAIGPIPWGAATALLGSRGQSLLSRSFLEGRLSFDIEQQLTPETLFQAKRN